ncbi:MAG: amino acid racemase [Defluviitaleaceae bacterium]|nr:amino acid racemase [Defluviitaleaceae bacterium]
MSSTFTPVSTPNNKLTNRTLGVVGGMGVQATARFYSMLTNNQSVTTEQEYLDVLIYSKSSIPDRTAFITGKTSTSPLGPLLNAAKVLEEAGVGCIAMPCVSAHFFYDDLACAVSVPFINMMDETAKYVQDKEFGKIGLLATDGTLHGRLFHKAFAKRGIDVVLPGSKAQQYLSDVIYQLKRGDMPTCALDKISADLYDLDAQAIVLGCTELGLLHKSSGYIYIEALEVLANAALAMQ